MQFHGEFGGFELFLLFCRVGQSVFLLALHFGAGATESVFVDCHCGAFAFAVQLTVTGAIAVKIDHTVVVNLFIAVDIAVMLSITIGIAAGIGPAFVLLLPFALTLALSPSAIRQLFRLFPIRRFLPEKQHSTF
jgi:type IV secretory pathway VirB6-like protein